MASFKLSEGERLWDPIRSLWVAATPEERVRQHLIAKMVGEWGYPKGLLAVEKDLASLAPGTFDPERRIDLLCFAPEGRGGVKPLLLVECKALPCEEGAESQLLSYNQWIGAPFLCLVDPKKICFMWEERGGRKSLPYLPLYQELLRCQ